MKNKLCIFNPEHDLALACDDENFNPPQSAKKFAQDLSVFPIWFSNDKCFVFDYSSSENWLNELKLKFPQLVNANIISSNSDFSEIQKLEVWGWDKTIYKQLQGLKVDKSLFPNSEKLEKIRELSHRNLAIKAHNFISQNINSDKVLNVSASECCELLGVQNFVSENLKVVVKAPWSGSGKGLQWVKNKLSDSHLGWISNILEKQKSVILEKQYSVVQNFAMEFLCAENKAEFCGYSLFETDRGRFQYCELMSDREILHKLCSLGVLEESFLEIQKLLIKFIQKEISPHYSGILGVDMFLYSDNSEILIHPCVEINLRLTMGYVARILFDKFINNTKKGKMFVEHNSQKGFFYEDNLTRKQKNPLIIENNKILSGYLSLNNVLPETSYRIYIEVS